MLTGSCHRGNITVHLEAGLDPRGLKVRACDCSFCRKHGVRSVMDPKGRARIAVAEFLVCKRCGAYAAAVLRGRDLAWAVLNANLLDSDVLSKDATPSSYGGETAQGRIDRRKREWTPAVVEMRELPGHSHGERN